MVDWVTLLRVVRSYSEVFSLVEIFIGFRNFLLGLGFDSGCRGHFQYSSQFFMR